MRGGALHVEPSIDPAWLNEVARADPISHAYALWDLTFAPDRVRFVTLHEGRKPVAYLLIWFGRRDLLPVVHWVGEAARPEPLLDALPPRPLIAVVPDELAETIARRRQPAESIPLRVLSGGPAEVPPPARAPTVRRLTTRDAAQLSGLAQTNPDLTTGSYLALDLELEKVWGAFEDGRLVAVARASVALPSVWIVGGVFTAPSSRGQGFGRAVTWAVTRAAQAAGALPALLVRADNGPARRIYETLGYRVVGRRVWIDAGSNTRP